MVGSTDAQQLGCHGAVDATREVAGAVEPGGPRDAVGDLQVEHLEPVILGRVELLLQHREETIGEHAPDTRDQPDQRRTLRELARAGQWCPR